MTVFSFSNRIYSGWLRNGIFLVVCYVYWGQLSTGIVTVISVEYYLPIRIDVKCLSAICYLEASLFKITGSSHEKHDLNQEMAVKCQRMVQIDSKFAGTYTVCLTFKINPFITTARTTIEKPLRLVHITPSKLILISRTQGFACLHARTPLSLFYIQWYWIYFDTPTGSTQSTKFPFFWTKAKRYQNMYKYLIWWKSNFVGYKRATPCIKKTRINWHNVTVLEILSYLYK